MDNIPSLSPPQSLNQLSTPQIRSRITVVCAEDVSHAVAVQSATLSQDVFTLLLPPKKCTNTYFSYAAAQPSSSDLHSLNNRLMQVEATLSLITSGQTPPVFQSSYPFSQIQSANPSNRSSSSSNGRPSSSHPGPQHHSQHHLAPPGTTNTFISVPSQVLASVWLDELERDDSPPLELKLPLSSSYAPNELNPIKLEAAPDPELPYSSTSGTSPQLQPPHASSSSHVPLQVPRPGGETVGKPCVTPALVALLPPLSRAKQLLQSATHLFSIRPFPAPSMLCFYLCQTRAAKVEEATERERGKRAAQSLATRWDTFEYRALCLIGSRGLGARTMSTKSDRKEREKVGTRAREIFFGSGATSTSVVMESLARRHAGGGGAKSESTKPDVEAERELFAWCLLWAQLPLKGLKTEREGQRRQHPFSRVDEKGMKRQNFFSALAQQSLDVWEKSMAHVSPSGQQETSEIGAVSEEGKVGLPNCKPAGDRDSEQARIAGLNKLLPLVAKIVNMARVFGLEKVQSSSPFKDEEHGMGKSNLKGDLNDKKRGKSEDRRRRKDDLKRMIWWDIVSYELQVPISLCFSLPRSIPSSAVKLPRCAGPSLPADEADSDQGEDEENLGGEWSNDIVEAYHGARYRLTKITQMVKHRMTYPDCCCGYTLDQAAFLEGEIRCFMQSMPPPLRFTVMDDEFKGDASPPPEAGDVPDRSILRMQRCALTIMAQRLIIMVYLPFLCRHPTSWRSTMSSLSDGYAQPGDSGRGNTWNPVLEPIFRAARCIIQASLLLGSCNVSQSNPRQVPPLLLDLYPVEKALLDAVTICTLYDHTPCSPDSWPPSSRQCYIWNADALGLKIRV
ncbi:hypothetical protein F5887DRAFT_1068456 [Amanita rubescens]|nr:hypothetical protein F5887DRAFT_1068456 [Amanita rubescens]